MSLPKPDYKNPVHWLAFGLGSGFAPKAPGTFGTLAAMPFYWFLLKDLNPFIYASVLLVGFGIGVWLCERTSRDLGVHDHGGIVIDEWIGVWLTLFLLPPTWQWALAGFVLFRFFDIIKPWPIRWFDERVHGGFGIMIDDVIAGLFALVCLHLAHWVL